MRTRTVLHLCLGMIALASCTGKLTSLVPDTPSKAPDYFCTWNTQGYAVSYTGPDRMRSAMTEENIFGEGPHQNWVSFFPKIRQDLYFVLDDSWDIPRNKKSRSNKGHDGVLHGPLPNRQWR